MTVYEFTNNEDGYVETVGTPVSVTNNTSTFRIEKYAGDDDDDPTDVRGYIRFTGHDLAGVTATSAILKVTKSGGGSQVGADAQVYGVKEVSPTAPTDSTDMTGLTLTTAKVALGWSNTEYELEVKDIVNEITSLPSYDGSAIMFVIKGDADFEAGGGTGQVRQFHAEESVTTAARPSLFVSDFSPVNLSGEVLRLEPYHDIPNGVATDYSVNGNNGTVTQSHWATNGIRQNLFFDGGTVDPDAVDFGDILGTVFSDSGNEIFSINAFIEINAVNFEIFTKYGVDMADGKEFRMRINNLGVLTFEAYTDPIGGDYVRYTGSTTLSTGVLYRVLVEYDGTQAIGSRVTMKVDNTAQTVTATQIGTPAGINNTNSAALVVGNVSWDSGTQYGLPSQGYIDSLRVFDRLLSSTEEDALNTVGYNTNPSAEVLTLVASPDTFADSGTTTATVTRTGSTAASLVVNLSSSATGVATVPATVTIPIGQASETFTITGVAAGSATITASATSFTSGTDDITVEAQNTYTATLDTSTIAISGTATLTVTRSVTTGSRTATISSSDTSVATVPLALFFPDGDGSETVTVSGVGPGTATITASDALSVSDNDSITVQGAVSFTLDSSTIGVGGETDLTVSRTGNTANEAIINLTSSATGVATVPATITIPAGSASAVTQVTGVAAGSSNIDGSNSLYTSSGAATVSVVDSISLTAVASPDSINADQTTTLTVTRTGDTTSEIIVNLSSDNTAIATVPETISIPAFSASNTVTVTGVAAGTATITATHPLSSNSPTEVITVSEPLALSVAISPDTFNDDQTSTVTVTRTGGDQTLPLTVDLTSSATGVATIPATVTILADEDSGSVTLTGVAAGTTTITASHADAADATAVASVNGALGLNVTLSPNPVNAGQTSTATITRAGGNQSLSLTVTLDSSSTSVATIPATVTIPANATSATVSVSGVAAGTTTITASHADAASDATKTLTVNSPLLLAIAVSPDPVNVGNTSTVTVTRSGGDQTQALVVTLSSSAPSIGTVPASLTIDANQTQGTATFSGVSAGVTTITASNAFAPSVSDPVTVNSQLVLGLSLARSTANAGQTVVGTVTRAGGNINSSLTVTLGSSNDSFASVASSVVIPAGLTSTTFNVTAVAAGTATITASQADAPLDATADIQVFAAPTLTVGVSPDPLYVGLPGTITVTRSGGDTSQSMSVSLVSSDNGIAYTASTLLISAGQTQATTSVNIVSDGVVTFTASNADVATDATDTVTIHPTLVLSINIAESSIADDGTSAFTVTRTGGNPGASVVVALSSTDISVATVPASVTIPANQLTASGTVTAVGAGTMSVVASNSLAPASATDSLVVVAGVTLTISVTPDSIAEDSTATVTVGRSGGDTNSDLRVTLSSSDPITATLPSDVLIPGGALTAQVTAVSIEDGTTTLTASHADAASDATTTLTVTPTTVRRAGSPIIDEEGTFTMTQRDDYEIDGEIGGLGPFRVQTSLDITNVANRLRFGASRLSGSTVSNTHMIGTATATAVPGLTDTYDLVVEITRTETDKTAGRYGYDIECVFSDEDVRTLISGEFELIASYGDNEARDPLNP